MFRRLFWMAIGSGVTVYVWRRSKSRFTALLPSGFARALGADSSPRRSGSHGAASPSSGRSSGLIDDLAEGAGNFVADFRAAQRERETELRVALLDEPSAGSIAPSGGRKRNVGAYDPDVLADLDRNGSRSRSDESDPHDPDAEIYEF